MSKAFGLVRLFSFLLATGPNCSFTIWA